MPCLFRHGNVAVDSDVDSLYKNLVRAVEGGSNKRKEVGGSIPVQGMGSAEFVPKGASGGGEEGATLSPLGMDAASTAALHAMARGKLLRGDSGLVVANQHVQPGREAGAAMGAGGAGRLLGGRAALRGERLRHRSSHRVSTKASSRRGAVFGHGEGGATGASAPCSPTFQQTPKRQRSSLLRP